MLKELNILLISPEPWDHIFVSKHHYAVHLTQRNNKVYFLSRPTKSWQISESSYENLTLLDYTGFIRGLQYFPKWLRKILLKRTYRRLEKLSNVKFDIIWSFDNSVFYDFDALPLRVIKISHIVDLDQSFQLRNAARTADLCIGTTKYIVSRLKEFNLNTHQITHGCNMPQKIKEIILPGQNKIKALYAGNLKMKFLDWEVVHEVVIEHPEIDFVFVGPGMDTFNSRNRTEAFKFKISSLPNVFTIGRVSPDNLQSYYYSADLLFLAYQQEYHRDQANPHKVMEYLISGKPVVCTFTEEYQDVKSIYMSSDNKDFGRRFRDVVENLEEVSTITQKEERLNYALNNTYDKQIDKIEALLNRIKR